MALSRVQNPSRDGLGGAAISVWLVGACVLLALLAWWQGHGYWEYSDGVYLATARAFVHGAPLYSGVAAAQPPPIFLLAGGALAISDTLAAARVELALVELAGSALVLVAVWRLTRVRAAAVAAGLLALLTPWGLREHAQLLPETFAAPLVLGAALAASRPRGAVVAGALGAAAAAFKVAFALPALVVVLAGRRIGRGLAGFLGTAVVLAAVFLLIYGSPLWDDAVRAQRDTGTVGLHYVAGLWAQASWNLVGLVVPAVLAWPFRSRLRDPALARSLAGAAVGSLLLLATLFKDGSYLTVVVVAEPPLLCLAAGAAVAAWRGPSRGVESVTSPRSSRGAGTEARGSSLRGAPAAKASSPPLRSAGHAAWRPSSRTAGVAIAVCAALVAAQVATLLIAPGNPVLFTRPGAASGGERVLSSAGVDRAVAAIRACPSGQGYGGPPFLAFMAGRAMAGDQPDQFIVAHAVALARFRAKVAAARTPCVAGAVPSNQGR